MAATLMMSSLLCSPPTTLKFTKSTLVCIYSLLFLFPCFFLSSPPIWVLNFSPAHLDSVVDLTWSVRTRFTAEQLTTCMLLSLLLTPSSGRSSRIKLSSAPTIRLSLLSPKQFAFHSQTACWIGKVSTIGYPLPVSKCPAVLWPRLRLAVVG